jgi:hypothetical protein
LAARDPGNSEWQRHLIVNLVKTGRASGDKACFKRALDKAAKPEAQDWECGRSGAGFSCGVDGQAVCGLEEKNTQVEETCGK